MPLLRHFWGGTLMVALGFTFYPALVSARVPHRSVRGRYRSDRGISPTYRLRQPLPRRATANLTRVPATLAMVPTALAPLAAEPRWLVWCWELDKKGRWTKIPYQGRRPNKKASSTEPQTWSDYMTAARVVADGRAD